jgi:hypothetical protein
VPALTIAVEGILDATRDAQRATLESMTLRRLVMHASSATMKDIGFWDWFGDELGIARQRDVPTAPIWARAAGVRIDDAFFLNATPVTMEISRTDVRLKNAALPLDANESGQLLATLNSHFANDGVAFVGPQPGRWFVRVAPRPALHTTSPRSALARGVRESLPTGDDSAKWRRWQNEIQMLLFEHPVNVAREARGAPVVNSVWFWGGGQLPRPTTAIDLVLVTDDEAMSQLGEFAGARVLPVARFDDAVASPVARVLLVLASDNEHAQQEDAIVTTVERAFAARRYAGLAVVFVGNDRQLRLVCKRPSLWQRLVGAATPPTLDQLMARWDADTSPP